MLCLAAGEGFRGFARQAPSAAQPKQNQRRTDVDRTVPCQRDDPVHEKPKDRLPLASQVWMRLLANCKFRVRSDLWEPRGTGYDGIRGRASVA